MQSSVFRKVALERLSSPEQLDQLIQITTPKGWLALFGLLLMIATAVLWALFGSVPTQVAGQAVLIEGENDRLTTIAYLPATEGKQIQPGMVVHVSPATVRVEESGYILGEVAQVSRLPVSPDEIAQTIGNNSLAALFAAVAAPIEIRINLLPDDESPDGYRWSAKPPELLVDAGTPAMVKITVAEERPVGLFFGN
jgi:hypothetical protein